ncbi:winged helix-turn-helix transcriptional regulator [Sphingobacterium siyangense]|uniref:HxlR family transcriptional regulator n=1 Tax=Sphingobacterium siyangense TaxID=459529 RepID=A0A562MKB1_9SPHI|nr:helix-turn-helix domain-containing protein [Sphingobacterium siyangense]TWI20365.1 HxlR family transcriptional regulator [Sphingobacterium siyangense]
MKDNNRSDCPISSGLDVWGDKWTLVIVRDLLFFDKNTYGEFLKSREKIATNILASRLLALEENGIIIKSKHPESKAKILYQLTDKGIELLPMMVESAIWGENNLCISEEIKTILKEVKKDKAGYIKNRIKELKA